MQTMNTAAAYKEQEIGTASPGKCVLYLYDAAIQGCAQNQQDRARRALTTLMDSLNFESGGEIANQLFGLYDYCLRMVHQSRFDSSLKILQGLRETWQSVIAQDVAA